MKELKYINTNVLWDEMSGIASEAIGGIEDVLTAFEDEQGNVNKEIETTYGTLYYEEQWSEVWLRNKDGEETPLREEETYDILCIADEVNEWISKNQ